MVFDKTEVISDIKHDVYVRDLCGMIKPYYDLLSTNVLLLKGKKRRIMAEIDVVAVKGKEVDVYEVKCNPRRIIKAKKQLRRIKKIMPNVSNTYFFSGDSGIVKRVE